MATTAELLARLRDLVAEEAADFYTDAELLTALNEAKDWLFSDLYVLPKTFSDDIVDSQSDYTSPTDLKRFIDVRYNGERLTPLRAVEVAAYKFESEGTPRYYCPEFLETDGDRMIRLYPTPPADLTDGLTGTYFALQPDLNTTTPVNPTWHKEFHYIPVWYAGHIYLRKDHRPEAAADMLAYAESEKRRYKVRAKKDMPFRPDGMMPSPDGERTIVALGAAPEGYPVEGIQHW